jgi:methyl-accepting chemotaxis protein
MPEVQEAPAAIDSAQLLTFANAIMSGDFTARLPVPDEESDAAMAARILNNFASHMHSMTSQLTRLSTELTEGKFGGAAECVVFIRQGPWRECLEAFNKMEWALTGQLRDFANISKRLAAGKFDRAVTVDCQGETLGLKNALNAIRDRLNAGK